VPLPTSHATLLERAAFAGEWWIFDRVALTSENNLYNGWLKMSFCTSTLMACSDSASGLVKHLNAIPGWLEGKRQRNNYGHHPQAYNQPAIASGNLG